MILIDYRLMALLFFVVICTSLITSACNSSGVSFFDLTAKPIPFSLSASSASLLAAVSAASVLLFGFS